MTINDWIKKIEEGVAKKLKELGVLKIESSFEEFKWEEGLFQQWKEEFSEARLRAKLDPSSRHLELDSDEQYTLFYISGILEDDLPKWKDPEFQKTIKELVKENGGQIDIDCPALTNFLEVLTTEEVEQFANDITKQGG